MLNTFKICVFMITVLFSFSATAEVSQQQAKGEVQKYIADLNFQGYQYPFAELTNHQYPTDQHYHLIMRSDYGDGDIAVVTVADENTIGSLDQTYDEALFTIKGRLLEYAAFYDDWSIKKTSELIGDSKIIRVTYDENSQPLSVTVIYRNDNNPISYQFTPLNLY